MSYTAHTVGPWSPTVSVLHGHPQYQYSTITVHSHNVCHTLHTQQVHGCPVSVHSTIRVQSHNVCHTLHTQSVIHCTHSRSVVAHDVCGLELERAKSIRYSVNIRSVVMHNVHASWSECTKSVRHYTQQVSGHPQTGLYQLSWKKKKKNVNRKHGANQQA